MSLARIESYDVTITCKVTIDYPDGSLDEDAAYERAEQAVEERFGIANEVNRNHGGHDSDVVIQLDLSDSSTEDPDSWADDDSDAFGGID